MGDPRSCSLDWQIHCEKTLNRLSYIFRNKLWTDCTFLVGEDEPVSVSANKFVLAMSSPVFDTMFNGSMPESEKPIRVPDVQPDAFRLMLEFMYTENALLNSYQQASDVYCAAKKYMLPCIMKKCVQFMKINLSSTNACFAHEFATLFDEESLLKVSLKTFRTKTKEILKEGSFYEAPINTVVALFSQNELDIDSELDLFKALERYSSDTMGLKNLKRSCNKLKHPSKKCKVEDKENEASSDGGRSETNLFEKQTEDERILIAEIRLALSHIRFLTLSVQAFSAAAYSVLLEEEEALAIMMNLAGVTVPLSRGICENKQQRHLTAWMSNSEGTYASTSSPYKIDNLCSTPRNVVDSVSTKVKVLEAMCTFTILNFKTRKHSVVFDPFYTDDVQWKVTCILGEERDPEPGTLGKTVGVLLECRHPGQDWECPATVTVRLPGYPRPSRPQDKHAIVRTFSTVYHPKSTSHGFFKIAPFSAIQKVVRANKLTINTRVVARVAER